MSLLDWPKDSIPLMVEVISTVTEHTCIFIILMLDNISSKYGENSGSVR
jgi:hypothetical protein